MCSAYTIDFHKKSHNWHAWDFFHTDQFEIKMNQNPMGKIKSTKSQNFLKLTCFLE